jgi:hypothetical protein
MASPIIIDGTTSIIPVNTRQLVSPVVQLPPLNLRGQLFTIVDTGGRAATNPITINMTGGATLDGKLSVSISVNNGSLSFSQTTNSLYISAQTVIRGNIIPGPAQIIISTPRIVISTLTSQSSLVVYNDLCTQSLNLGGAVYALGGFQPSIDNPYVSIDYLSAITVSTQSISVGKVANGGGLDTTDILASSVFVSSSYNTNSINTSQTLYTVSSYVGGLSLNGQPLYSYNNDLYLNKYKINNDINFLVPQFTSSIKGLVSSLNLGPGVSSLSTSVGLLSSVYNANPGLSTLSTYNASRIPVISGADTSTVFGLVSSGLSSANAIQGLSSLSTTISRGLSSLAYPFSLSSLIPVVQQGISSVFEGLTISTLYTVLSYGLSSVNQNTGIDKLTENTRNQLSTTATTAVFSSISTQFGYGYSTINVSSLISSVYQNASTSFSNLSFTGQISSFSTILEAVAFNVNSSQGLSSLSTSFGCGFSTIDMRVPVSTLSTTLAQGMSSLSTYSVQLSSLSTSVTRQLSTLLDLGISSLLNDLSKGASTVFSGPGISSFGPYQSTSFFNINASKGLSSLSTSIVLGLSTVITGISPSSQITFSSLNASSISLYKSGTVYGSLIVDNNIFTVNGHSVTPPNNNFEYSSSISTYKMFVGSTTTSLVTLYPSSLTILEFLTTSSVYTTKIVAQSTIVGTISFFDAANGLPAEIRATAAQDLLLNGSTLFINENIGLSSLSTYIGPAISSISGFINVINAISSGFSTLGLTVPRISTLSSLYGYRITPDNVSTGVSTLSASMSTLVTSTLTVQYLNLWSTFASTIYTSSLIANVVSSFSQANNSYFIASTVSTGQAYISTFPIGIQINSMSTNTLTFDLLNANNLTANTFFASTIRINTGSAGNAGNVFLKDNGASYTTARPLEFSTFYPLYGSGGFLAYNSTIYSGGLNINNYSYALSTSFLSVSTVGSGVIYTSTINFTGKVQFDRLVVLQSTCQPMFVALECGIHNQVDPGGTCNNPGRLYVSPDGITWSNVDTTGQPSWVGKSVDDASYPSANQLRLAWNGTYFLAWGLSIGSNNVANSANSNNAISYDGINWSNVPRRSIGQTSYNTSQMPTILWDGTQWWKTNNGCNSSGNKEWGDATSPDGITWTPYLWYTARASFSGYCFNSNLVNTNDRNAYALYYNGDSMICYPSSNATTGADQCSGSWTRDFSTTYPLFSNALFALGLSNIRNQDGSRGNIPIPWSDGYSWWFPNQFGPSRSGLYRMNFMNYNTGGIPSSNPSDFNSGVPVITACVGVGFDLTGQTNDGSISFCGYYNGQMHIHGRGKNPGSGFNAANYPSSQTLVYSYDGIYFFPSPSVQGICAGGTPRTITYAAGKWVVGATGAIGPGCNTQGEYQYNTGRTIWYSYDGLNWAPSKMVPSQQNATFSLSNRFYPGTPPLVIHNLSNLQGSTGWDGGGGDDGSDGTMGGGIASIIYMSNMNPALDFNGVRIYNQPGGICWNNNVTREQSIVAYQSSIMLHNMILISGDNSVSSLVAGTNMRIGIANHNPSTTLDLGGVATVTAERLYTSSLYILPSTGTNMFSESYLPLSSFNFYVHGSTFMSRLAVNVPKPVTILDISGANALFRSQGADCNAAAKTYLTNLIPDNNVILGPSMMYNSTCMSIFYKSGGTTYKRSYGGSNFFTGQHATVCLDISGALVSSFTSTITESGISLSTIWTDYSGYLLSSADLGYMSIPNSNLRLWASNAINVTEALPYTRITTKDKDPAVFGIVTNNTNNGYNEDGSWLLDSDPSWGNDLYGRVRVNSIGEGALWVTNVNGNISNGDFLCSSAVPGHARKQDEDAAYNFTVAKATMSCTFDLGTSNYRCEPIEYNGSTFVRAYIGVTYNCG